MDPNKPVGTMVAGANKHAVAAASMVKLRGDNVGSTVTEPMHTASAGGTHHGVVAASIVREFGQSVGQDVDSPAPTVMPGGGGKTGLLAAYIAQHNGGFNAVDGRPADAPASTLASTGSQQQVVAASIAAYYGTEADGQGHDEPARTTTVKNRFAHVESTLVAPLTPEQVDGALRVAAFLRDHGVTVDGDFAGLEIAGARWVIVDIGMRMLTPRELFRAQGFPESYIIDHAWHVDPQTGEIVDKLLTKEQQIRMCGNSVCPDVARALVLANVPELAVWFEGERRKVVLV
jgi:DNA (cytosine-5)-methyltransferase 1